MKTKGNVCVSGELAWVIWIDLRGPGTLVNQGHLPQYHKTAIKSGWHLVQIPPSPTPPTAARSVYLFHTPPPSLCLPHESSSLETLLPQTPPTTASLPSSALASPSQAWNNFSLRQAKNVMNEQDLKGEKKESKPYFSFFPDKIIHRHVWISCDRVNVQEPKRRKSCFLLLMWAPSPAPLSTKGAQNDQRAEKPSGAVGPGKDLDLSGAGRKFFPFLHFLCIP